MERPNWVIKMVSVYYRDKSKVMRRIEGLTFAPAESMNQLSIENSVYTLASELSFHYFTIYQQVK